MNTSTGGYAYAFSPSRSRAKGKDISLTKFSPLQCTCTDRSSRPSLSVLQRVFLLKWTEASSLRSGINDLREGFPRRARVPRSDPTKKFL